MPVKDRHYSCRRGLSSAPSMSVMYKTVDIVVQGIRISCFFREAGPRSILFIHGLGASKKNFAGAFGREELEGITLLAPDLPGFGESERPDGFSYGMQEQAGIVLGAARHFGLERLHLLAHSMGGIVGIELCRIAPGRILSFINVEGNLTPEDCTLSRRIGAMPEEEFLRRGFDDLRATLGRLFHETGDGAGKAYLACLAGASPAALHRSALETVRASDRGDLMERFSGLPFYRCYVYGEKNRGLFPAEKLLAEAGVPVFYIPRSGHSPMDDNPADLYGLVRRTVDNARKGPNE
jgi:pimeloyl-ACP methyl ester carboxylesterase